MLSDRIHVHVHVNIVYFSSRNSSFKKLLEYLFWVHDPTLPGGAHERERVLEEGFMDADTHLVCCTVSVDAQCEASANVNPRLTCSNSARKAQCLSPTASASPTAFESSTV